jgi:hypothetical protein
VFETRKAYDGNLIAQLTQWQAASDKSRESDKAWLDITTQFQRSAEQA